MRFSRQEYWSGLHFLLQEIFPTQGSSQVSDVSCTGSRVLCHQSHLRSLPPNEQLEMQTLTTWPALRRKSGTRKRKAGRLREPWSARTDRQALDVKATAGPPRRKPGSVTINWDKADLCRKALQMHSNRSQLSPTPRPGEGGRRANRGSPGPCSGGVCPGV